MKTLCSVFALSALFTTSALAQGIAGDYRQDLAFNAEEEKEDSCPKTIAVYSLGDSFSEGVRLTFDIKQLQTIDSQLSYKSIGSQNFLFEGQYKNGECSGKTAEWDLASGTSMAVDINDGKISVTVRHSTPSFRVEATTWNNQAILRINEIL